MGERVIQVVRPCTTTYDGPGPQKKGKDTTPGHTLVVIGGALVLRQYRDGDEVTKESE